MKRVERDAVKLLRNLETGYVKIKNYFCTHIHKKRTH